MIKLAVSGPQEERELSLQHDYVVFPEAAGVELIS
jgi:hypothetical protein